MPPREEEYVIGQELRDQIIAALRAGGGEAVAWMYECGQSRIIKDCRQPHFDGYTEIPLYSAPPAPDREKVARALYCVEGRAATWDDEEGARWAQYMDKHREHYYRLADAAIAAMRGEP